MNKQTDTLNYYNSKAAEFISGTIDVSFSEIQDMFLAYIPKGGHILDFGCGSGRDTKYFLSKGYVVDATDGSEQLCKLASKHTGITVKQMLFEELEAVEEYDGIWACASILHVEKGSLPSVLRKMVSAVKSGGTIYTSFKYGDFEGVRNGRYFTYLTEQSLKEIIDKIPELLIEKMWISGDVRADRGEERWLNIVLKKQA